MDMLLVATSLSDELFGRINIEDFERTRTPKIRGFLLFSLQFSASPCISRMHFDEMAGDGLR